MGASSARVSVLGGQPSNGVLWLEGSSKLAHMLNLHTPHSGLFRLTRIVGTGKTFLFSTVVDSFQQQIANEEGPPSLALFYCDRLSKAHEETSTPLLQSLIRQVTTSGTRESREIAASLGYRDGDNEVPDLTVETYTEALLKAVELHHTPWIALDGLDRLKQRVLRSVLDTLSVLLRQSFRSLKLFISSRDRAAIRELYKASQSIAWHINLPRWDIENFAKPLESTTEPSDPQTYYDIEKYVRNKWPEILPDAASQLARQTEGV